MKAHSRPAPRRRLTGTTRDGFTLVEILIVIVIIGILMGIAIPAVTIAINRGKNVSIKMEVNSIESALEQYEQKYGDYPPDFSSWVVIERHYRKIFPRIAAGELARLRLLLDVDTGNDTTTTIPATFPAHDATAMDRGEVIAWVLGGYSDNPLLPFTGPGGPLEQIVASPVVYQMNADRSNKLFDFEMGRLDYSKIDAAVAPSLTNRYISSDGDLFASYAAYKNGAPYVYFDSRTYSFFDTTLSDFNGYGSTTYGVVRPYFSNQAVPNTTGAAYGSQINALAAWKFMKPDTFQVIAPGLDGAFGTLGAWDIDGDGTTEPLYFQYPTGAAIAGWAGGSVPGDLVVSGVNGYQERSTLGAAENFQLDNITNFSNGKIVDDVQN